MKLIPGDAAQVLAGPSATRDEVELIREDLGLNEPLYVQYGKWLARAVRGDLGRSIELKAPVTTMVLERFKNTAILAGASMLLAVVVGVTAGVDLGDPPALAVRPAGDGRRAVRQQHADVLARAGADPGRSRSGCGWFPSNGMYDIRSPRRPA